MKKRLLSLLLIFIIIATLIPVAVSANDTFSAIFSRPPLFINGNEASLNAYLIEGHHYFNLRDLGEALDFYVGWDSETGAVTIDTGKSYIPEEKVPLAAPPTELEVVFFDVGQGDCVLVTNGDHAMLIDAGNIGQDELILNYLSERGIRKLDYLVATHPHADHIGSMASVIRAMDRVASVVMPDITHTTKTFERLIEAVEEKNIPTAIATPGDIYKLGEARARVLAPNNASYKELNNYSIVLRVDFGERAFLLAGDAEAISENEQLAKGYSLDADVLKVGHHGSRTGTSQSYLNAVSPKYAVISLGDDNAYGHPHSETLTSLSAKNIDVYRTDLNGTIVFNTDGKDITVVPLRGGGSKSAAPIAQALSYFGNKNSKVFHLIACRSLPQEANRVVFNSRADAVSAGFSPCGTCKP